MSYPLLESISGPDDLKQLDVDRLVDLASEVRHAICDQVSKSGGHLAPNLGVVELTIALHRVFDFSYDRLLFDVGHQCYPHKLLTGRLGLLDKLRQKGGMSGFPAPAESEYDQFAVGHAGTGVSTAVGMARGDDILAGGTGRSDRKAVTLVGDASIVNGVSLEGLNNAGTLKRQFLVVLNDNGMSIAPPQGAMANYFDRVRVSGTYADLKRRGREVIKRLPASHFLEDVYHRGGEMIKAMIDADHLFEHFGLACLGPIDGHDLPMLIDMLEEVKDLDRPVLLHVKTKKGKGFTFSEGDATTFHSPKPFVVEGCRVELKKSGRSFTAAFADAMLNVMENDPKVFACSAAMPDGTGVNKLLEAFPERTLDTGICESHAMDMCAGMAKAGVKPFFAVYSTFAQRALDQVFQEVALQGLPVRICMDRAGYVGGDGAVHHGFMDIAMFRALPGVVQLACCDEPTLVRALEFMRQSDEFATTLRYPRDSVPAEPVELSPPPFELGKAHRVMHCTTGKTPDVAVLAYGVMVYQSLDAARPLRDAGYEVEVYDARFAAPVDASLIESLIDRHVPIVTVEDHAVAGGFGTGVLEAANAMGLPTDRITRLGMPAKWFHQDSRGNQLKDAGLDAASIEQVLRHIATGDTATNGHATPAPPAPAVHVLLERDRVSR